MWSIWGIPATLSRFVRKYVLVGIEVLVADFVKFHRDTVQLADRNMFRSDLLHWMVQAEVCAEKYFGSHIAVFVKLCPRVLKILEILDFYLEVEIFII